MKLRLARLLYIPTGLFHYILLGRQKASCRKIVEWFLFYFISAVSLSLLAVSQYDNSDCKQKMRSKKQVKNDSAKFRECVKSDALFFL